MTKKLRWLLSVSALLQSLLCRTNAATPGTVVVWGDNSFGQANVPAGLSGVTAVASGGDYTVALKNDGTAVAWGSNSRGQTSIPTGLSGVVAIAGGYEHIVRLLQNLRA